MIGSHGISHSFGGHEAGPSLHGNPAIGNIGDEHSNGSPALMGVLLLAMVAYRVLQSAGACFARRRLGEGLSAPDALRRIATEILKCTGLL